MTDLFDMKMCYLKPHKENIMMVLRLGLPSGVTQAIFSLAMVVVQSLTNSFGEMVIAANVIIMRVDGFAMMPNFSFGTAMTTYSGQNVGAGKLDRVKMGAEQGTLIAVGTSAVITGIILLFGRYLMAIFTSTEELVILSANMMGILAVGYFPPRTPPRKAQAPLRQTARRARTACSRRRRSAGSSHPRRSETSDVLRPTPRRFFR